MCPNRLASNLDALPTLRATPQFPFHEVGVNKRPKFKDGGWEVYLKFEGQQIWSRGSNKTPKVGDGSLKDCVEYANKYMAKIVEAKKKGEDAARSDDEECAPKEVPTAEEVPEVPKAEEVPKANEVPTAEEVPMAEEVLVSDGTQAEQDA